MSKSAETVAVSAEAAPVIVNLGADLSPAIKSIETAYRQIQKAYPGTPDAVIVVKRDERAWGHTTVAKTWAHVERTDASHFEIMISGENLRRGAVHVAATLLHESAHAANLAAGQLDTDTNGRHNKLFKAAAEARGLLVESAGWHGFTATSLDADGEKLHAKLIKTIAAGLAKSAAAGIEADLSHLGIAPTPANVGPDGEPEGETPVAVAPPKRGNRNLLVATCGCGSKIRLSRGVLEACRPMCQECDEPFEV